MGMRLLEGRDVTWNEPQRVAVVNAAAASRFWPGSDALGKHVGFGRRATDTGFVIVGIVSDVRRGDITAREEPMIYVPLSSAASVVRTMMVVVRGPLGTAELVSAAKRTVHDMDATLPVYEIRTVEEIVRAGISTTVTRIWSLMMMLSSFFRESTSIFAPQ